MTRYEYDAMGRMETVINALGKTMAYAYDETGSLTEHKDYAGNVTKYAYDGMDRIVKKTVGDEATEYAYSDTGLLLSVKDKSGTIKYQYDQYDRLTKQTNAEGVTISYTYDKEGRISTFDNGFGKTTYAYDVMDRVTKVIDRNGKATVYEYDSLGNRSAVRYPNGNVMTYTYDACQRLKEECIVNAGGTVLAKYSYGIGKAGERLSVTELVGGIEMDITYKYDKLNRLVKETIERDGSKLINEYAYDEVGNRTTKETTVKGDIAALADTSADEAEITEGKTSYTYNALNQLVMEQRPEGGIFYTYDSNGNLIKQSGIKDVDYSYDKENHLLRATIQKGNSVTIESYTYDYAGNRTSKTVNEDKTTYYVTDTIGALSQVVAETDRNGKETASYTRGDNSELLSMEKGDEVWYYLYDGHGSTRLLTNEAGRITDKYAYDAYGNILEKEGDTENDFLYTGEQYNANIGLYYLRARYMNPATGTFISMDSYQGSIYDPVSLHKYLYANANPVMYTDPSGYESTGEAVAYMDCTTTMAVAEAYYNAMIFNIGMKIIAQLRAIQAVEAATHLSSETVLNIGIEGAFGGTCNKNVISAEMLMRTLDVVTLAYLIADDCIALNVVATSVEQTQSFIESMAVPLTETNRQQFNGNCVYLLLDSQNKYKVSYVGRTNNPWRRYSEHKRDPKKRTNGVSWKMFIVQDNLSEDEAKALENALICIFTIDALANARHEIAQKNFSGFQAEFARASSICKIPLSELYDVMKGDYK